MSRASRRDYRERSKKIPKKTDDLLVIDSRRMWKPISMRFACKPVQAAYNVLMGQILKAERDNFDPNNEDRIESGGAKYVFFGFHPEDDDPEFDGNKNYFRIMFTNPFAYIREEDSDHSEFETPSITCIADSTCDDNSSVQFIIEDGDEIIHSPPTRGKEQIEFLFPESFLAELLYMNVTLDDMDKKSRRTARSLLKDFMAGRLWIANDASANLN